MPCPKKSSIDKFYSSKPCDKLVANTSYLNPCCSQDDIPFIGAVARMYVERDQRYGLVEKDRIFMEKVVKFANRYIDDYLIHTIEIIPNEQKGMNLLTLSKKFFTTSPLIVYLDEDSGFLPLPDSSSTAVYIVHDLQGIKVPRNKAITITGSNSSVDFDSIYYFKSAPGYVSKFVSGITFMKIDFPFVTNLSDKDLFKKITSSMTDIGRILLVEPYVKTAFKFSFMSSITESDIREYVIDMPFENHPRGTVYTEQIGDTTMTLEISKGENHVVFLLEIVERENLEVIHRREIERVEQEARRRELERLRRTARLQRREFELSEQASNMERSRASREEIRSRIRQERSSEINANRAYESQRERRLLEERVENLRFRLQNAGRVGRRDAQRDLDIAQQRLNDWDNHVLTDDIRIREYEQSGQLPVADVPRVNPSTGSLPRKTAPLDIMDSISTDIITFEDMTVRKYLSENAKNMVLFESNFKPHFTNKDDLGVAMDDGIVYACREVSTRVIQSPQNVDTGTELFNARRIGPISGYINANDLISAMNSVGSGSSSRMFLIKESHRTIPAVISKKLFNNMDSAVSANHCQVGAEGGVHNVVELL